MGFKRNDWICRSPSAGVRLADIELRVRHDGLNESLATELPRLPDGSMVVIARRLTDGIVSDKTILEHRYIIQTCKSCDAEMLRDPLYRSWKNDYCQNCNREIKRKENRQSAKSYRIRNELVKKPALVQCAHCETCFTPKRSTSKFCSTRCRVAAHRASNRAILPSI